MELLSLRHLLFEEISYIEDGFTILNEQPAAMYRVSISPTQEITYKVGYFIPELIEGKDYIAKDENGTKYTVQVENIDKKHSMVYGIHKGDETPLPTVTLIRNEGTINA